MEIRLTGPVEGGNIDILISKAMAHRLLTAGALSSLDISGKLRGISKDIDATAGCLSRLEGDLYPGESGSTLRFLLPVCGALGRECRFHAEGRLASRPMSDLFKALSSHGCTLSEEGTSPITIKGKLESGTFRIPGNISSQYVTGLLFALPLTEGDSRIEIEGRLQSRPYVDMTLDVLAKAGITVTEEDGCFNVPGGQTYALPEELLDDVEGDWSNGAFWIVMDALIPGHITVNGLDESSRQGDRRILDYIPLIGHTDTADIDVADIPDLVPVLSVLAAARKKGAVTNLVNGKRLRYKESDRLAAVNDMLSRLGGSVIEGEDSLTVTGTERLAGGTVDAHNDHRIVMAAAAARCISDGDICISGAEAVRKSYPGFFEDYEALGGRIYEGIR